ncbi:MBL fold metallo-hydrolase [Sphaerisporangium sp. NPDC051017]|uniref:MBL fold metallo-hydrolase n=1 Tax=Sphaerisporangium sp. NPDC051017 TaxID=3154636 RepID=UPI0034280DF2
MNAQETPQPPEATRYAAPVVQGDPVEVADRVYVIPDRRVPLVPNIGIVVGDRAALVIDTGVGPGNGAHVRDTARRLAGGLPLYLAITQLDPGHGFGAQAFKGHATIVYSAAQRDRSRHHATAYLATFRGMGGAVAGRLDGMELVEPDLTYHDRCEIDLGGMRAVLRHWGPAHTADDQTVLVDGRVLFAGDLLQSRMFPILPYFPPFDTHFDGDRWIEALDELIALDADVVVPGHGEVTDTRQIREVRAYLAHVREQTADSRARGVPFDDAAAAIERNALARWPGWEVPRWIRYAAFAYYHQDRNEAVRQ